MRRREISPDPAALPSALRPYLGGRIYDTSSSGEARVYFLEDAGLYLKRSGKGALATEAKMTSYFYSLGLSVEVVDYISESEDWLLTVAGRGEDATAPQYLGDGRRLAAVLGEALRTLHDGEYPACPVPNRTADYLKTVEERAALGIFDPSFLPEGLTLPAADALALVREAAPALCSRVLLHGDYCLPNILLEDFRVSGFIDLGGAGIGDRHIDLFWGAWTLAYNLGTDRFREDFFAAYGQDRVDRELLLAVAAAECFG